MKISKWWGLAAVGLLFCAALAGSGRLRGASAETKPSASAAPKTVPVVLTAAQTRDFDDAVSSQGNLKAKNYALVSPRLNGVLDQVFVREGDLVQAGQTRLFQTDSLKLQKSVEMSRQEVAVARCALKEKEAAAEKTEAEYRKAKLDFERYQDLYKQKIVSLDAFEDKQSAFDQLTAVRKYNQTLIELSREELKRAETALAVAEKDLRDASSLAPIDGVVSQRLAEPGEMGAPGSPVVRIDDVQALEASAHLPAQFYARIMVGRTKVRIGNDRQDWGELTVDYKSPTIDPTLRTFEIKCRLAGNRDTGAVPGALAQMTVILAEHEGLGVPTAAVVQRAGKSAVFLNADGAAKMVTVQTGLETGGWTEILPPAGQPVPFAAATPVVSMGQFLLNDGTPITPRAEGE